MKETTYKCPVCQGVLVSQVGNFMNPGNPKFGVGLYCPHETCGAQEVAGHGNTENAAFEIITNKFKGRI